MGKHQKWFLTSCVFLFLSLASQIHSINQLSFLQRLIWSKQGIGALHETKNFNAVRRINMPSAKISGVNQKSSKEKDLIKRLPGQPKVNFKQYSGHVTVNETAGRNLFYYFVEAVKPTASTPLVIWFNGGPGCSSLLGAFTEHGPFRVHSDGKTLFRNPYAWNNEANILYLEAPAGVGFSFVGNTSNKWIDRDYMAAEENYIFLVQWLERFPEYKGRELYVTGQSYAGHYVPQLAQLILHGNYKTSINLQGVLIGNPGLDAKLEGPGGRQFLLNHGIITQEMYDNINDYCGRKVYTPDLKYKCISAGRAITRMTNSLDLYSIYAPVCLNTTALTSTPNKNATVMKADPCTPYYMKAYLNSEKTQEAMNVIRTTKSLHHWDKCNDAMNSLWNQGDKDASTVPILYELMGNGVRVWIYSGDTDGVVPTISTLAVLKTMNKTIESASHKWFSQGEVAGLTEVYKNNFTFATVRGAGHSVPTDRPTYALTLFTSFIRNKALPLQ